MVAKNHVEIRPLGPFLDLCLLKKKVSTCAILTKAYKPIIGGRCCSHLVRMEVCAAAIGASPRSHACILSNF